ncbi:MAG: ABC transporter substrate-binding protein [Pasteurellaceae bacterium]|nr:ABC transporter substrate-binding protein [Pasteurellaceae bacterium]
MLKKSLLALCLIPLFTTSLCTQAKTIQDIKGDQIELPDNIERIADLWHANNQIVLLLGGADKLVATTNNIHANKWYNLVHPSIKNVPVLTNGEDIQLEELLNQQPQVVLLSKSSMQQEVEKAGLKGVKVSFQDFDGLKKTVAITADVIGGNAPNIAKSYISELENNIKFVEDRIKNLSDDKKPTVIHIANQNNLLKIDGGKSMIGDWINKAGGKNALPDQANLVDVSMEELIKANPDVIIIGSTNAQNGVDKILNDPSWQSITAVKNKHVFVNPLGTFPWDRYSAEEALQILWAAKLFHPELFKDVDMIAKTQAFYQKYYHYELSKQNAEQILKGLDPITH